MPHVGCATTESRSSGGIGSRSNQQRLRPGPRTRLRPAMRPLTVAVRIRRNSRGQERRRDREQEQPAATATGTAPATATGKVALHQHPCCTAATPKGPQYCSFLVAQAPRGIHSTRLLLFQRNGTDEGVPSGGASAAGAANWTVASEIAAFGATQLGDMCSVPL